MRDGQVVFDLPASSVTPAHLHDLYAQHLHELDGPAVAQDNVPDMPVLPVVMHCR
jgi:phosphonate transport system ATP-binding protein